MRPILYVMVGIPASGKSTYAAKIPNAVIHSSDALREELFGDVNYQGNNPLLFRTLHKRILSDLKEGKNVVYDATNIYSRNRIKFLRELRYNHINAYKVCVWMDINPGICVCNNKYRERNVPEDVIDNMYIHLQVPKMSEGWDCIKRVTYPYDQKEVSL